MAQAHSGNPPGTAPHPAEPAVDWIYWRYRIDVRGPVRLDTTTTLFNRRQQVIGYIHSQAAEIIVIREGSGVETAGLLSQYALPRLNAMNSNGEPIRFA